MSRYDTSINLILDTLEASLNAETVAVQVLKSVRVDDKEYKFPNIVIMIDKDEVEDFAIGGAREHTLSLELYCSIKTHKGTDVGSDELITFIGDVVATVDNKRLDRLNGYCNDMYLTGVDYHWYGVDNYILFVGVVKVTIEYIEN